jgi:hypothetical protein
MRTDLFVARLVRNAQDSSYSPEKLAAAIETGIFARLNETPTGQKALAIVRKRIVSKAVRELQ